MLAINSSADQPLTFYRPPKREKERLRIYQGENVPHVSVSFDSHFNRQPALWLDHSSVYGGIGFGKGGFRRPQVTCHYHRYDPAEEWTERNKTTTLYARCDIWKVPNFTRSVMEEVVEALADNRLRLLGWKREESAFQIDDRDKPALVQFMTEQLARYF